MWNGNNLLIALEVWSILPSPCMAEERLGNSDVLLNQTPLLRLAAPNSSSPLYLPQSDSHQFRVMAAVLRHCLLIVGPTEDKTEELHRWVTSMVMPQWNKSPIVLSCI